MRSCGSLFMGSNFERRTGKQAYRRKGAATALLNLLEKELSRRSVVDVRILTGSTNHSAQRTYENKGYSIDNEAVLTKQFL
ncbi:GNAT family N-acetyltransferase [Paenibacillus typhae]